MKIGRFFLLSAAIVGCVDSRPSTSRTDPASGAPVATTDNARAETNLTEAVPDGKEPDNTKLNVRDYDSNVKTPVDQFENAGDIEITASIRSKVVETEMSVAAHNIKIITQYGRVTLQGPVRTEQEKQMIQDIAKKVAGSENVDNRLEVAAE